MLKIYGTMICPDCVEIVKLYGSRGIAFTFLDFSESTQNLKDFLKIRDQNPLFDPVKAEGNIGIPCIVSEDGTVSLDPEAALQML